MEAVTARWDANQDGLTAGYRVYWDNAAGGGTDGIYAFSADVGNATSFTPTLLSGLTYFFTVRAYNAAGTEGPPAPDVSITLTPGAASLISPIGATTGSTPTYQWNAVQGATSYYIWVNDSTTAPKLTQWISPAAAGCATGTGTCAITLSTVLSPGYGRWWIRTWNSGGLGSWSAPLDFLTNPLNGTNLLSPAGLLPSSTPTYMWSPVAGATYYYIWVNDSTAAPKITQWFSASAAGCASGTCSATPAIALAPGAGRWWIRTWNETQGYGPWSAALDFTR